MKNIALILIPILAVTVINIAYGESLTDAVKQLPPSYNTAEVGITDQLAYESTDKVYHNANEEAIRSNGVHIMIVNNCVDMVSNNNTSLEDCKSYVQNYNKHMKQLFNESQTQINAILLGANKN